MRCCLGTRMGSGNETRLLVVGVPSARANQRSEFKLVAAI